ncbi:MAG: hypothetical protein QOI38_2261, partial [Sphingomonadales bacterium]|nr:hypothetical protein [Sphingomonadales bacterium]
PPAPPVAQAEIDRFEAVLESDPRAAGAIIDALAAARANRPATLRPDPLLSGLAGRYYLRRGWTPFALAHLRHADAPDVPRPQLVAALLALAEAQALSGDRAGAARALGRLEALAPGAADRRRAALLAARVALVTNPGAALEAVRPLLAEGDAGARFEAEFIAAQAHALLGDRAAAEAAADRIWATAAAPPAAAAAPVRAALLRAALAEARGDADALAAMLNAAGAQGAALAGDLTDQLPVCGDGGVLPGDYATFGLLGHGDMQELLPLTASRPAAVATFHDALSQFGGLRWEGRPAAGLTVTVRCRTLATAQYRATPARNELSEWFAEHGLFFTFLVDSDPEGIAALSRRLGELEERFGPDHPHLIPLQLELAGRIMIDGASDGIDLVEADRLHDRAVAAMRRIGGADRTLPPPETDALLRRMARASTPEEAVRYAQAGFARFLAWAPLDDAFAEFQLWIPVLAAESEGTATALTSAMLARFPAGSRDPRRRALHMRLAALQAAAGDRDAARASYRAAGVPANACVMMDEPAAHVTGTITTEDYPPAAILNDFVGTTAMEFTVGPDGNATGLRLIFSAPGGVFDRITEAAFARFGFTPARHGGRTRACSGQFQRVLWQLPAEREDPPPPDSVAPAPERI